MTESTWLLKSTGSVLRRCALCSPGCTPALGCCGWPVRRATNHRTPAARAARPRTMIDMVLELGRPRCLCTQFYLASVAPSMAAALWRHRGGIKNVYVTCRNSSIPNRDERRHVFVNGEHDHDVMSRQWNTYECVRYLSYFTLSLDCFLLFIGIRVLVEKK